MEGEDVGGVKRVGTGGERTEAVVVDDAAAGDAGDPAAGGRVAGLGGAGRAAPVAAVAPLRRR